VERLAVNDEPWPSTAVLPPPEYLLRAGGLVVAVPLHVGLPKPLFLIPREPAILMNVIAVPDDEPAGPALLHALDVRDGISDGAPKGPCFEGLPWSS